MTTPTPTEQRLRSMLIELADSTPVRVDPPVRPSAPIAPAASVDELAGRRREVPNPIHEDDETGGSQDHERRRRRGGSRRAWVLTAAAGVLVAVLIGSVLRMGDAADPFAHDQSDVPAVDLGALSGGRLAFVMGSDLFIADAAEGVTRRITHVGRGNEVSHVSWSHDGEWVAFDVHDESGLWVVRRDGSERHHLPGRASNYSWSPTNDELAYAVSDEVRVAQVDGSWRALKGNLPPVPYTNVVWSPDGNRLAFAGTAGNLAIGTLQGRPGAGWNSGVSPPVRGVVAWPRDDHLVVQERTDGTLLTFDPPTGQTTALAVVEPSSFTRENDIDVDPTGSRMVVLTEAEVWMCPLDQGPDHPCAATGVPGVGLRSPRFVPSTGDVSFVSVDPSGSSELVTLGLTADPIDRTRTVIGRVDSIHRGTIDVGDAGYGVEPEAQVPVDGDFLVRVDEGRIERLATLQPGVPRLVVDGARFDRPSDNYPGGSGLAYWHP